MIIILFQEDEERVLKRAKIEHTDCTDEELGRQEISNHENSKNFILKNGEYFFFFSICRYTLDLFLYQFLAVSYATQITLINAFPLDKQFHSEAFGKAHKHHNFLQLK